MATPYMGLTLPVVSVTLGPAWATQLNAALDVIDEHDHTTGKGQAIVVAALDIDDDLPMNGFRLQDLPSLQLNSLANPVSGVGYENSLSSDTGDLYWTNGAGTAIQITSGSSIISPPANTQIMQYDTVAADLIIGAGDDYIFLAVDTAAPRTITLPLASSVDAGRIYVIKDATLNAEAQNLTVAASGSDDIDGEASIVLDSNGGAVFLICDGVDSYKQF